MTTLAERLDAHQQTQSTTGKFGSWHQDSAARCLDLVTSVIEPEIAARVAGLEAEVAKWKAAAEYANARLDAGRRISMAYEPSGSGEGRGPHPTGQGFGAP